MTDEEIRSKNALDPGEAQEEALQEPVADKAPPEPEVSAESDPIPVEGAESEPGLLARLNPFRMFRRNSVESFIKEGKELVDNGSYAQATVVFQKALEMDPKSASAYRGLGKVYFKKRGRANLEISLQHYRNAIRLNPRDHELYAISAKVYDALGKRKEATLERKKFVIVRALDADPKNPIANNNMGILSLQQGVVDTALSYFQKALDSDKNYDVAHRNIAATYLQIAKKEQNPEKKQELLNQARGEIKKALDITPSLPSQMAYARILLMSGEYDNVLEICQIIDEMDPANKDVYFMKKLALEGLGRFEDAKDAGESYEMFKQDALKSSES